MTFPDHFAPRRAAELQRELSGVVAATRFVRLAYPYEQIGTLFAQLRFGLDGHERIRLEGELRGEIAAECQRCLKPMSQEVSVTFGMLVLSSAPLGADAAMEEGYLVAEQDSLDLINLLEDELLLALPMVPRHADGKCVLEAPAESPPTRVNPFHALAVLKGSDRDSGKTS